MSEIQPGAPPSLVLWLAQTLGRHAITALAGLLAGWGVIQPSQNAQFIALGMSAVVWGVTVGWSLIQKKDIHTALMSAEPNPPGGAPQGANPPPY